MFDDAENRDRGQSKSKPERSGADGKQRVLPNVGCYIFNMRRIISNFRK
jgi:hypothetical protein